MSIEWLLTKAQSADVRKGTSKNNPGQTAPSGQNGDAESAKPDEHETDDFSPIHFRCRCGCEGTLAREQTEVQSPADGKSTFVNFKCASCGRPLRYDCQTGTIKGNKSILGLFLDKFS